MNKGSKNGIAIAICLLIAGVLCLIVSLPFGGFQKATKIMEGKNIKIFGLNGIKGSISIGLDNSDASDGTSKVESNGTKTKLCDGKGIKSLDIDVGGAKVIIEDSKDSDYYVQCDNNITVRSDINGSTLIIDVSHEGSYSTKSDKYKVYLYIPKDTDYDEISLSIGACDLDCDPKIKCEKLDISLGAGNMDIDKVTAVDTKIEVGAGRIDFGKLVTKNADIKVGAGDFEMDGDITGDLNLSCAMGNADLKLDSKEKDHDYDFSVGMGTLKAGSVSIKGMGDRTVNNGTGSKYIVDLGMGNVKIEFD